MKPIIVNVELYGNCDQLYTELSMIAPEGLTIKYVTEIIESTRELYKNDSDVDRAVDYLKKQGFISCKTLSVDIGGN